MSTTPPPPPPPPAVDLPRMIGQWRSGIRIIHIAHTRAAADYARWERLLGLSVAVITAVTGSTVFANANNGDKTSLLLAGAFTIAAAVLAAAHTFLDFGTLTAQHAAAAKEYGALRRDFEAALAGLAGGDPSPILQTVRTRWGETEAKYPFVSQNRYAQAQRVVSGPAELGRQ